MDELIKNRSYEAVASGYTSEGLGICRVGGRAVFIPGVISGEGIRFKCVKVTSGACYGILEEILSPSPARAQPSCSAFPKCGGCELQHMSYSEELSFKLDKVNGALKHIGGLDIQCKEIIGADNINNYRNKAIYAVSEKDGVPNFGFYRERSHDVVPVSTCLIQDLLSIRVAESVVSFMREKGIHAFDEQSGKGAIRHIFVRKAYKTSDAVACICSYNGFGSMTSAFVERLRADCPELTGIVLNINRSRGNSVLSGDFYTLWGRSDMTDILCGYRYSISPRAFFQVNPAQTEKLYMKALEYAIGDNCALALDLYCGAGTISLLLSSRAEKVIGAEIIDAAVENARYNAAMNSVDNVEFICSDAGEAAAMIADKGLHPDVIVVDPPRKGLNAEAIDAIIRMAPERVVYVSCNPATLARDLKEFYQQGYCPETVTAVDMFPRTSHVETVLLLSRTETTTR